MGPSSTFLLVLVLVIAVGLFVVLATMKRLVVKIVAGVFAFVLTLASGVLIVNDFYGYYTSWGAAVADITGNANSYAATQASTRTSTNGQADGRLQVVSMPGKLSGINREGLVYLPPQYFERSYRTMRFPVVELLHGSPGDPAQWINQLRITEIANQLIDEHKMGPVVLVLPDSNGGLSHAEECLNNNGIQDDTYVTQDVRSDIVSHFRVSADSAQWGTIGVSSGGYCAANLMMRHRSAFGSVASIDGYYRPQDGNAAQVITSQAVAQQNDPLSAANATRPGTGPLPPFWVAAGTGEYSDYVYAKAMVDSMRRLEQVPFLVMKGAHHTMPAVRAALPSALAWSWQQLCTPDQRRDFPTVATRLGSTVTTPITRLLVTPGRHGTSYTLGDSRTNAQIQAAQRRTTAQGRLPGIHHTTLRHSIKATH